MRRKKLELSEFTSSFRLQVVVQSSKRQGLTLQQINWKPGEINNKVVMKMHWLVTFVLLHAVAFVRIFCFLKKCVFSARKLEFGVTIALSFLFGN